MTQRKPQDLRNGVHSFDRITTSLILSGHSWENINLPIHKLGDKGVTFSHENWIPLAEKKQNNSWIILAVVKMRKWLRRYLI